MREKENKIISGAATLGVGTFIAKFIGALYRVPLTAIIGGAGIGLYQMVFPLYAVLLDFSGAAAPSATSKLIASHCAEEREEVAKIYLSVSIKIFLIIGLFFSFIMFAFSKQISILQGNAEARLSYMLLSPSIFLVCVISSFRGYFQGLMNMRPTAISQILEQVVKLIAGLSFSSLFMPDITRAAAGAALAITLSEVAALIQLFVNYKRRVKGEAGMHEVAPTTIKNDFKKYAVRVIKTAVPVTLSGVILPLSHVLDSFLIINILNRYAENSTSLFGLFSGVSSTVAGLPVAVCYGLAIVAIPYVSGARSKEEKLRNSKKTLLITFAVSVVFAIVTFCFSEFAIKLLFRSLSVNEIKISVNLLKILSLSVVFLSLLQTVNASLIGCGKLYSPLIGTIFGVAVKTILEIVLLKNEKINIYGAATSVIACYFIAVLINFIILISSKGKNEAEKNKYREFNNG